MGEQEPGGRLSPEEYRTAEGITPKSEQADRNVFLPGNVIRELESALNEQQVLGADRNQMKLHRLEKELPEWNEAIKAIPKNYEEIFRFMKDHWPKPGSTLEDMWLAYGEDLQEDIKRFREIMNPETASKIDPQVTIFRLLQLHSQVLALKERLAVHLREEGA